jgi:anti-sigma B factor antagonist
MVHVETMPDRCRLALSGELTIYHAAALKAELLTALADLQQPLEMDLSDVTELDTAGVQLLLAVGKQYQGRLVAASAAVQELVALYGLSASLRPLGEEVA